MNKNLKNRKWRVIAFLFAMFGGVMLYFSSPRSADFFCGAMLLTIGLTGMAFFVWRLPENDSEGANSDAQSKPGKFDLVSALPSGGDFHLTFGDPDGEDSIILPHGAENFTVAIRVAGKSVLVHLEAKGNMLSTTIDGAIWKEPAQRPQFTVVISPVTGMVTHMIGVDPYWREVKLYP